MTEDDILRAAMQVGLVFELPPDKLFAFAALVAAHEREECAKVCEEFCDDPYAALTAERIRRRNQE